MSAPSHQDNVSGILKEIRFHEDGFLIAVLNTGVVVKGRMLWPEIGLEYLFTGFQEIHPRYGSTFRFDDYVSKYPASIQSIRDYLTENIEGIGPKIAERITDAFAENTLQILKNDPALTMQTITGITAETARSISNQLKENEERETLCLSLKNMMSGTRIPKSAVQDVIKLWGDKAPEVIKANPYILIEKVDHIGFAIADAIARNVGFDPEGYPRIKAGSVYILHQAAWDKGHVFLPKEEFLRQVSELLCIESEVIEKFIPQLIENGKIKMRDSDVYLASLHHDERSVAEKVRIFMEEPI